MWRCDSPVERGLIWTVIKHLQELTSPQVEHELRINTKVIGQPEARGVFFPVIGKLLAQTDKHTIKPTKHIR